jgi:tetratricopeptide (TPR) repeat protein
MLLLAAALVALLFSLPRVVVDNTESGIPASESNSEPLPAESDDFLHNQDFSEEDLERTVSLKASIRNEENPGKTSIFADSLAELYLVYQKFDSAATYFERAAKLDPSQERWIKAGNTYYEAFTFAMEPVEADFYGQKVRECLQPVLDLEPERLDLKTKVGMTLVSSSNPMQGITMLREVLEIDPGNEEALYNLGILAFQTGQYSTAITRFENLVEVRNENTQAHFYLGLSYKESGEPVKAKEQFEIVKELDKSPEVQATVNSYLEELE